jgi:hypothetical protein
VSLTGTDDDPAVFMIFLCGGQRFSRAVHACLRRLTTSDRANRPTAAHAQ